MTNESDRELLELAALAAGVEYAYGSNEGCAIFDKNGNWTHFWNPLADDGDALRLAVKLHMDIEVCPPGLGWVAVKFHQEPPLFGGYLSEPHGEGILAATRRAIVRAAAEIGKQLKDAK